MNRYVSSFFISIVVYGLIFASTVYLLATKHASAKETSKKPKETIRVCVVHPEPVQEPVKPKQEPKPKKPIEKPKPKPKKKPVVKPKPKPVVKPKPKEVKKVHKPKQEPKPVQKNVKTPQKSEAVVKNKTIKKVPQKIVNKEEIEAKQNAFMVKLRNLIDKNKSYPRSARRRGIEGSVEVKFNILANGNVKNIDVVSGKSIFKRSAIQAIEKSFPVTVDKKLFSFPKEFKITLIYSLRS